MFQSHSFGDFIQSRHFREPGSRERIVGLFTVYFLAVFVCALIERDWYRAQVQSAARAAPDERHWQGSVEVYPEGCRTRRPTARHVLDLLENVRRYHVLQPGQSDEVQPLMLYDELTLA